jgi:hypothetical protein
VTYVLIALLILLSLYPLSYAKYNWGKKQYLQSIGMLFIVMVMLGLPIYVLFTR